LESILPLHDRLSCKGIVPLHSQLDESLACPVIFVPADSLYLLGAMELEIFRVQAGLATRQLRPIPAFIAGFLASACAYACRELPGSRASMTNKPLRTSG